jgi:hypothetical protein
VSFHSLSALRPAAVIIMYVTSTVLLPTVLGALYRIASLDFRRPVSKRLVKPWSSMIASVAKSLAIISSARRALAVRRVRWLAGVLNRGICGDENVEAGANRDFKLDSGTCAPSTVNIAVPLGPGRTSR